VKAFSYFFPCGGSRVNRDTVNGVVELKTARITLFSFLFSTLFTRTSPHGIDSQGFAASVSAKVTAEKTPDWVGATPLFRLSAAQKVHGVAPALTWRCRAL
jgi:hypothetical protein